MTSKRLFAWIACAMCVACGVAFGVATVWGGV